MAQDSVSLNNSNVQAHALNKKRKKNRHCKSYLSSDLESIEGKHREKRESVSKAKKQGCKSQSSFVLQKSKNRSEQERTCTPRTSHPSSAETPSPPGPPPCLSLRWRAKIFKQLTSPMSDKHFPNRLASKFSV